MLGTNGSTLVVTGYTINDGNGGNDYTVTLCNATGTITPAALTITATSDSKVYDGTTTSTATPTTTTACSRRRHRHRPDARRSRRRTCWGPTAARWSVTGYTVNDGNGGNDYTVTYVTAPPARSRPRR